MNKPIKLVHEDRKIKIFNGSKEDVEIIVDYGGRKSTIKVFEGRDRTVNDLGSEFSIADMIIEPKKLYYFDIEDEGINVIPKLSTSSYQPGKITITLSKGRDGGCTIRGVNRTTSNVRVHADFDGRWSSFRLFAGSNRSLEAFSEKITIAGQSLTTQGQLVLDLDNESIEVEDNQPRLKVPSARPTQERQQAPVAPAPALSSNIDSKLANLHMACSSLGLTLLYVIKNPDNTLYKTNMHS